MELKFKILKKPYDLKTEEIYNILRCVFPDIPEFKDVSSKDYNCVCKNVATIEFIEFDYFKLGCSIIIWENLSIEVYSNMYQVKNIPILSIVSCLITTGAIKIVDNLKE